MVSLTPPCRPARDIAEAEIGLQRLLGIAQEEALLEIGERRAPLQPVIGGKHRAAGNAGEKVERGRAATPARCGVGTRVSSKPVQHAVGKRRRARAAAGERQRHDHVVVIVGDARESSSASTCVGLAVSGRLIGSLWMACGAAGQQGGTRNDAPRADRTLEPTPTITKRLLAAPPAPSSKRQADAKSKTSLRLMRKLAAAARRQSRPRRRVTRGAMRGGRRDKMRRLSSVSDSRTYSAPATDSGEKCRFCRTISLRISRKPPSLRDRGVTALARNPSRRTRQPRQVASQARVQHAEIGLAHSKIPARAAMALSDSPRISDTCASPPDSSPQSPHLVVDSEFHTKS